MVLRFPEIPSGEDVAVSATSYVAFRRCPEQAAGRLRGAYPADTRASFRGGLAHRVFARHLSEGEISDEGFAQACREEIGSGLNPKIGALGLRPSDLTSLIKEVGGLYERFKRFSSEGFRAAEVFIELEPAQRVTLRGSIDAVYDDPVWGIRLIDWKTGDIGAAALQLEFYALLWALDTGALPGRVEAFSVKTGESLAVTPTEPLVEGVAASVAEMVTTLRAGFASGETLERSAGPWCRFCPLLDECSEGAAAVDVASA